MIWIKHGCKENHGYIGNWVDSFGFWLAGTRVRHALNSYYVGHWSKPQQGDDQKIEFQSSTREPCTSIIRFFIGTIHIILCHLPSSIKPTRVYHYNIAYQSTLSPPIALLLDRCRIKPKQTSWRISSTFWVVAQIYWTLSRTAVCLDRKIRVFSFWKLRFHTVLQNNSSTSLGL